MFRKTLVSLGILAALTASAFPAFAEDEQPQVAATAVAALSAPVLAMGQPKGQIALQSVLDELLQGKSEFAAIMPMARLGLLQQKGMVPALSMRLQGFGGLKSVSFAGVQNGIEVYDVRFAEASMIWGVIPGQDGKISHIRWKFD